MKKNNKGLSLFLIIQLLFIPVMIIVSDNQIFNNLKIQYTYINSNGEVEFGEISNNQELAIQLNLNDHFLVRIWNYGDEDFYLDTYNPINIIEAQGFVTISETPDTRIPAGMSISFLVLYDSPYAIGGRRGVIEIVSDDPEDEDFEFGLWLNGYSTGSSGGGSGGSS